MVEGDRQIASAYTAWIDEQFEKVKKKKFIVQCSVDQPIFTSHKAWKKKNRMSV